MTVGLEKKAYPFIMAGQEIWTEHTELVNCSQPGFTASDACAFFFRHKKDFSALKAVIIYLGNCDANATEIRKGRYTAFRGSIQKIRETLGFKKPQILLKNKLHRFAWDNFYNPHIERPESPSEYKYNLSRIISHCARSAIPVLLVRPRANLFFPPGLGKGNFIFYKYLDFQEKFSSVLSIPDKQFIDALRMHEEGECTAALEAYKNTLKKPINTFVNAELPLIVVNNYAVCTAEAGNFAEAEQLLQLLLKEKGIRKEIILFNLAHLYRLRGDMANYRKLVEKAYDADSSLYRVKNSYIEVIDRLALDFPHNIKIVDMSTFADYKLFIDHCHLVPEGQGLLTEKIMEYFAEQKITGGRKDAKIRNILYNPELALGNTTEFYKYYKTYAPYSKEEIKRDIDAIRISCSSSDDPADFEKILHTVSREMERALGYYLKYPCFPSIQDVLRFAPEYPHDIGRFPEIFLIRHIVPYLRIAEREPSLAGRFSYDTKLLHTTDEFVSILPEEVASLMPKEDPYIDREFESSRLDRIIAKVNKDLLTHLRLGNQIHERLRTTIFWFFRETLRWGAHSRISMRYDRLFLEYCAEALALAGVLDLKLGGTKRESILRAVEWVEKTDSIHSCFAKQFSLEKDCSELLVGYDQALLRHAEEIENYAIQKVKA